MNARLALERDPIWDAFSVETLQYLQAIFKGIQFRPEVPEDVVKRFDVIKKLILHSYAEYAFLDVAGERALTGFEMALKIRYQEIENDKVPKRFKFIHLIKWAADKHLFEDGEEIVQNVRKLRNHSVHPKRHNIAGLSMAGIAARVVELINELYDDADLRRSRKVEFSRVFDKLKELIAKGCLFEYQDQKSIVFLAVPLFYENRIPAPEYSITCWPIFPITSKVEVGVSDPIAFQCDELQITNESISFLSKDEIIGILKPISDPEDGERWHSFIDRYTKSELPISFIIDSKLSELRRDVMNDKPGTNSGVKS